MIKKLWLWLLTLWLFLNFSFAVNYVEDLWAYEDLGWNNNCTINSDLSFDCSESNNVIIWTDTSWYKTSSSYFRTTSWLAVYIHQQNWTDIQWLITSFAVAWNSFPSYNSTISYEDFLTYYNEHVLTNWSWSASVTTPGRAGPDFVFWDVHIFFYPETPTSFAWSITPVDFWLQWYWLESNWSVIDIIDSPFSDDFTWSIWWEILDPIDTWDIIDYYEGAWNFNSDMCYVWTFDLTWNYEDRLVYYQRSGKDQYI